MTVNELRHLLAGVPGHLSVVLSNDVLGDFVELGSTANGCLHVVNLNDRDIDAFVLGIHD